MKKVMLLGGNYYQMTATKAAKKLGYYTISCDYIPNNPAHKFADEYHNISTTDKDGILELAKKLNIDGIVSYASDVAAPTAAYVAEKLGLPTNPYESVKILTRKDYFKPFMEKNGFVVPRSKGFTDFNNALEYAKTFNGYYMVKPVDASGSKGVCKINNIDDFSASYELAMSYSLSKTIVIEEFIQRDGYQIAGDGFIIDGKLVYSGMANEHFDKLCNPLVPIGESFPSILDDNLKKKAHNEIQRMLTLLNWKSGAINLDFIATEDGKIMILEIGPRNGGNLITDAIKLNCDLDLAELTIKAAVGDDISNTVFPVFKKFTSSYVIHSIKDGKFKGLKFSNNIEKNIKKSDLFVEVGDEIHKFDNGGYGIGAMILEYESSEDMIEKMDNMEKYIEVEVL